MLVSFVPRSELCICARGCAQNAHGKDSCSDHVDCEDTFSGPDSLAHHGNTSYTAGPAAALVFYALHANQASCFPNTLITAPPPNPPTPKKSTSPSLEYMHIYNHTIHSCVPEKIIKLAEAAVFLCGGKNAEIRPKAFRFLGVTLL